VYLVREAALHCETVRLNESVPGIDNTKRDELYCVLYVFVFILYYILYYFCVCALENTPQICLYYVLYCVLYVFCINTYFVLSDPAAASLGLTYYSSISFSI